jgi:hypothetical protein
MAEEAVAPPALAARGELEREASYLHHALFGEEPAPAMVTAYIRAHALYRFDIQEAARIGVLVDRGLDVEAVELVLRRKNQTLTKKLRILLYLAEAMPIHYQRLVNSTNRRAGAWVSLIRNGLRTATKYVEGRAILRRNPDLLRS